MKRPLRLFAAALGMAAPLLGQHCERLDPPSSSVHFGCTVAVDDRFVAVSDNEGGNGAFAKAGSVSVFDPSGRLQATFAGEASGDQFGVGLDLAGTTLAVGAPGADRGTGAVYVFELAGTTLPQRLTAGESARRGALFGEAVALRADGSLIAVGAPDDSGNGSLAGAVYLFARSGGGWTRSRLEAAPRPLSGFGAAVALDGGLLAVGAPFANGSQGEVWIFHRDGESWGFKHRITAEAYARAGAQFGGALALEGTRLAVAANRDDPEGRTDAGAVYLYEISGDRATLLRRVLPTDSAAGDLFGSAVALDRGRLLVGARRRDGGRGGAYLFEGEEERGVGTPGGEAGQTVALRGNRAVVGAYLANRAESCPVKEDEVKRPDLACTIGGPATVAAGGQASYSITVTNKGTAAATGVKIAAAPEGLIPDPASPLDRIEPGESKKITMTFQAPVGCAVPPPFRPEATVTGSEPDSDTTNNSCQPRRSTRIVPPESCGIVCPNPFLSPDDPPAELPPGTWGIVEGPAKAFAGSVVEYRILLANGGPGQQPDGAGHELEHTTFLELESVTADLGEVHGPQGVSGFGDALFWEGSIPFCGVAEIRLRGKVPPAGPSGRLCLQGLIGFDADRDGKNETARLTGLRGRMDQGEPLCVTVLPAPE